MRAKFAAGLVASILITVGCVTANNVKSDWDTHSMQLGSDYAKYSLCLGALKAKREGRAMTGWSYDALETFKRQGF